MQSQPPVTLAIAEAAAHNSLATAICGDQETISYGRLQRRVAGVCQGLIELCAARGIAPRTRVVLNIDNENLRLVAALAAIHVGLVPILVRRLAVLSEAPSFGLVIGSVDLQDRVDPTLACDLTVDLAAIDRTPGLVLPPWAEREDHAEYLIGATSGSTGRPKPVAYTVASIRSRREGAPNMLFTPGERVLSTIRPLTAFGFTVSHHVLLDKACLVRASNSALQSLNLINLFQVQRLLTVPKQLSTFMDQMQQHAVRCPSLRRVSITGGLFTRALVERAESAFQAEIEVVYGTSETAAIAVGRVSAARFEPGYVGELLPGRVLEADSSTPEQPGALTFVDTGNRLAIGHASATAGEPARYRLPDLGAMRDGRVYITGRADEVFVHSGNKIAFTRIEQILQQDPALADVAVAHATASEDDTMLVIAWVAAGEAPATPLQTGQLWAGLQQRLPSMKGAEEQIRWVQLRAIPRNAMGKVDRLALLELAQQQPA